MNKSGDVVEPSFCEATGYFVRPVCRDDGAVAPSWARRVSADERGGADELPVRSDVY